MDYNTAMTHMPILEDRIEYAKKYKNARVRAADAQFKLEIMLTANLNIIRESKPNVGYDMAVLMLLEDGFLSKDDTEVAKGFYKDVKKYTAEYKGLERLMSALESKVTFVQSLMKFQREND